MLQKSNNYFYGILSQRLLNWGYFFIIIFTLLTLSSCSSSKTFSKEEVLHLSKLPEINDELIPIGESPWHLMISPSQFVVGYKVFCEGIHYDIGLNSENRVCYISTNDTAFTTNEGLRIGNTLSDVKEVSNQKITKELGWAYYLKLNGGWHAAFVEGESMTDEPLSEDSEINFFFKRRNAY